MVDGTGRVRTRMIYEHVVDFPVHHTEMEKILAVVRQEARDAGLSKIDISLEARGEQLVVSFPMREYIGKGDEKVTMLLEQLRLAICELREIGTEGSFPEDEIRRRVQDVRARLEKARSDGLS